MQKFSCRTMAGSPAETLATSMYLQNLAIAKRFALSSIRRVALIYWREAQGQKNKCSVQSPDINPPVLEVFDMRELLNKALEFADQYRRWLLGMLIAIVVYALAGFFLAPWLVKKNAIESVRQIYDAELRIEEVAINPFVLSLRIDGLELDSPDEQAFVRIEQILVNFQLSSLFRWAWTFREIRIDMPEMFVSRDGEGNLNVAFLVIAGEPSADVPDDAADDGPARLMIHDFAINEAVAHWSDDVPAETVDTTFGPVNVAVSNLNTLPLRPGRQDVVITTESSGTFAWRGSLQLNPLHSSGHASVKGSHFPLLSAYIRHEVGFDIYRGNADVELDYAVDTADDGSLVASVDEFELVFGDVAVRTFTGGASGAADADRDVLLLPSLRLSGGTLRWPERRVSLASVTIDDAIVSAYRNASGQLNLVPARNETLADERPPPADPQEQPWNAMLGRLDVNDMSIGLIDDSVAPQADIGVEGLDLAVTDISNVPGASFPTTLSTRTRSGGTIRAEGVLSALPETIADLNLEIEALSLALLHPYIQPLADVHLDSGALNLSGRLFSGSEQVLQLTGNLAVVDFLITETDEGSRLGSWKTFDVNGLALDLDARKLDISELRFDQAYADILVAADGTVNLGRVEKGMQRPSDNESEEEPGDAEIELDDAETDADLMDITIGRVVVANAAADFADRSLPLPFEAKIAELNGDLSTIATSSVEPATISLEGKVDDYGLVTVAGAVTPLEPALDTDIMIRFQNVGIPKFSAYTIAFAGREIASGKLDLDLGYKVNEGDLVGENKLVLREFELGEKVEHPGAMSLPLGLAVALLKDSSGKIDIDLPVRGNVNDPEFKYGSVVMKALANLIVKIVASPFALLGKLVGVEASELEQINFIAGRADLTPPELERAAKLAEALALRPELVLEIGGVYDPGADTLALKTAQLNAIVAERIDTAGVDETRYTEQRRDVLEQLFRETVVADDPDVALQALQIENTAVIADEESGKMTEQLDELAYLADVEQALIEVTSIPEEELVVLANARVENTRAAIVAVDAALDSRIRVVDVPAVGGAENGAVPMKVRLTIAGEPDSREEDRG
jgi:uncharacterized protein involved in outer membrane biogenesis